MWGEGEGEGESEYVHEVEGEGGGEDVGLELGLGFRGRVRMTHTHIPTHRAPTPRTTPRTTPPLKRQRTFKIQGLQSRHRLEGRHESFDTLRPQLVPCAPYER